MTSKYFVLLWFIGYHVITTMATVATSSGNIRTSSHPPFLEENTNLKDNMTFFDSRNNSLQILNCFNDIAKNDFFKYSKYYDSVVNCLNTQVVNNLDRLNSKKFEKLKLLSGSIEFERDNKINNDDCISNRTPKVFEGNSNQREATSGDSVQMLDKNVVSRLNSLSQSYSMKIRLIDGVKVRLSRGIRDIINLGLVFDEDNNDVEDDDDDVIDDDDDDDDEEEDDEEEEGRAGGDLVSAGGGGHAGQSSGGGGGSKPLSPTKKKKKKKNSKKKEKEYKEKLPMLLIPFIIQGIFLPLFLANLKLIAIKSIIVGKITLFLVGFNYLRRLSNRRKDDDNMEHIAINHYGYNGDMEYGAFVNRRSL